MHCPACERPNPDDARFCEGCGGSLAQRCPGCARELPAGARFCSGCGRRLESSAGPFGAEGTPVPVPEMESDLREAIALAREMGAKLQELRATTSLARQLARRGRTAEGRELLAPLYAWFTEGFGARDLVEAKALLDALG